MLIERIEISESADPHDPPGGKAKAPHDPVRRWTIIVGATLLFLLALQIASDRTAPVSSIGTVEGLVLPISSRVSGELLQVAVSDDEIVEAGTVLFEIDPTPFRLAVEAAEAELAQVGQSIGASTAEVAAAQARVAEAQAVLTNSRAQAERTLELVERGVTPAAQGDEAIAAFASGEATVAAAEADLRSAEEALGPAGANNPQLRAAQAALETAQFDLSQTRIVAPTRGRVTNFSLGPGETATAGQPILTMIDLQGAWIIAYFRENQLGNMNVGDAAEVALDVLPGQVWPARLVSFAGGIMTVNFLRHNIPHPARRCSWRMAAGTSVEESGERDDKAVAEGRDRVGHVPLRSDRRRRGVGNPGKRQVSRASGRCVVLRGNHLPFGDEEAVGGDAQCGVVVKAAPAAPLVVAEPELLLQLLIVALHRLHRLAHPRQQQPDAAPWNDPTRSLCPRHPASASTYAANRASLPPSIP